MDGPSEFPTFALYAKLVIGTKFQDREVRVNIPAKYDHLHSEYFHQEYYFKKIQENVNPFSKQIELSC